MTPHPKSHNILDHPFYFHGHDVWVLGSGYGELNRSTLNLNNPIRRDVFIVNGGIP